MMYDCFIYFIATNIFRLPNNIMTLCVSAWPPLQCVPGVKWPGCSVVWRLRMSGSVLPLLLCAFHGMQRDNFTSTFLSASTWCGTLTCEGKGHPITYHESTQWEWTYNSTHSQPSCQMGVGGQCHIPAATPQERNLVAIVEEADVERNWYLKTSQKSSNIIHVTFHLHQQSKHRVSLLVLCMKFSVLTLFFISSGFLDGVRNEVVKYLRLIYIFYNFIPLLVFINISHSPYHYHCVVPFSDHL